MKIGFIGFGKMGCSIAQGIVNKNVFNASDVYVYDVYDKALEKANSLNFNVCKSIEDLFKNCSIVLFSIKPQEANSVINSINSLGSCQLILTIMAGVPIKTFDKFNVAVCRIMPNTCAVINQSASSLCYNNLATENEKQIARNIFLSVGTIVEIEESLMDDVIPLAGSFTAYAYTFMKSFIDSATKRNIPYNVAKDLVIQSMIGSANMFKEFGDIDTLINNVCSKGGTTIAGLDELNKNNFSKIIDDCSIACANRSKELGKIK